MISFNVLRKNQELCIGIHSRTKEQLIEDGRKGGKLAYKCSVGIFNLPKEELIKSSRKGGKKAKELGLGIHNISLQERIEINKKSNETNKKNRTGFCYGITSEKRIEIGKKSMEKVNSQRWMCEETGFISTSGPLTNYQKARGIDTSKRIRLD